MQPSSRSRCPSSGSRPGRGGRPTRRRCRSRRPARSRRRRPATSASNPTTLTVSRVSSSDGIATLVQSSSCAGSSSLAVIVGSQSSIVEASTISSVLPPAPRVAAALAGVHEVEVRQPARQHQPYGVAVLARGQQPGVVGHVVDDLRLVRVGDRDGEDPGAEAGRPRRTRSPRAAPASSMPTATTWSPASMISPSSRPSRSIDDSRSVSLAGHVVDDQLVVAEPEQQVAVGLHQVRLVDADLLDVGAGVAVLLTRLVVATRAVGEVRPSVRYGSPTAGGCRCVEVERLI